MLATFFALEERRFNCHLLTFQKGNNSFKRFLLAFTTLLASALEVILAGLGVSGNYTFEVAQNNFARSLGKLFCATSKV